jgi:hypothetical protein
VEPAALRQVRADFLATRGPGSVLADLEARDAVLDQHDGRFWLWFEADLYDQLQLIEILSRLDSRGVAPEAITLTCIGEHPGIAHFGGLGELTPAQLAALPAEPLTAAALAQARAAWAAFRSPTPEALRSVASSPRLRFLGPAFDRLAREYPSTRDGLSLTERRILAALADGPASREEIFARAWQREPAPFLGDTSVFARIADLQPLLRLDGDVSLTEDGRRVLEGTADRVELVGIDRWIGGVHLTDGTWRFDEAREIVLRGQIGGHP